MHIGFYEGQYWTVEDVRSPHRFFSALHLILDQDTVIYLESSEERDESDSFLDHHRAPNHRLEPVVSNLSPEASLWSGHFMYSSNLQLDFETYFKDWNSKIADNIICYRRGALLMWFQDAFSGGELLLGPPYSKDVVAKFCAAMAPTFELRTFDSDSEFGNFRR